jgi:hypothetical protein
MNNEFDALMRKGDADSIRRAYELLYAHERTGGLPPGQGMELAEEVPVDWDLLEQIALTPTPRERIGQAVQKAPAWLQTGGAVASVAASFGALWFLGNWAQASWYSSGTVFHRAFVALLMVMAATLSIVTVGGSVCILIEGYLARTRKSPGRISRWAIAPLCASVVCMFTAYWSSGTLLTAGSSFQIAKAPPTAPSKANLKTDEVALWMAEHPTVASVALHSSITGSVAEVQAGIRRDPVYRNAVLAKLQEYSPQHFDLLTSNVANQTLTPGAKVGAAVMELHEHGLRVLDTHRAVVPKHHPAWEGAARAVEEKAILVLRNAVQESGPASPEQLTSALVSQQSQVSANACTIERSAQKLECQVVVKGDSFTGEVPLGAVAANVNVFRGLDRYAASLQSLSSK